MTALPIKAHDTGTRAQHTERDVRALPDQYGRPARFRWLSRLTLHILILLALFAPNAVDMVVALVTSPWPMEVTLRHLRARSNCATAFRVGLAPASYGEPGYWPHLDRDNDGIACEAYRGYSRDE